MMYWDMKLKINHHTEGENSSGKIKEGLTTYQILYAKQGDSL